MGHDDHRAPRRHLRHIPLDVPLAFIIEGAGGFIEDQNPRLTQDCTSNRNSLTLAAGQGTAAFADDRVIALRQLENKVVSAG